METCGKIYVGLKVKTPSKLDYTDVPGIKTASRLFVKSILRKLYIRPKKNLIGRLYKFYVRQYRLPIDEPIFNDMGIPGVFMIASYTDNDKDYLPGMVEAATCFQGIITYHDKSKKHDFSYNESLRFQLLIASAKRYGAKWVLVGSPKTRFSSKFRSQILPYIEKYDASKTVLGLKERYLWESFDQYAYPSNITGDSWIYKFFTITDEMAFDNERIHAKQYPVNYTRLIPTEASRFYIGRFNIETMKRKAEFYERKDGKDYSYLYNMGTPKKHNERVMGIGAFETAELL